MDNILNVAKKIVERFVSDGVEVSCQTDDMFTPDNLEYFDHNDEEIVVGQDNNRDQWVCGFEIDTTDSGVGEVLKSLFGSPSDPTDGTWYIDGVTIVHDDNQIQLIEDFEKVSKK